MTFTRRDFLKNSAILPLATALPTWAIPSLVAPAQSQQDRDTVLVVVQLTGGNDGLNTVVPYADDEYAKNRPTLALPEKQLHKIDSYLAFHPGMRAMSRLYKDGSLSIVQGVGSPNPDRSHEGAMQIWHTADPDRPNRQTGWLGRTLDNIHTPDKTQAPAVFVGPIATPFSLNAARSVVPSIRSAQDLIARRAAPKNNPTADTGNPLQDLMRQCISNARENSSKVEAAINAPETFEYPSLRLAGHLNTVARLIAADTGIRIFFVEIGGGGIGGFDNHANQLGNHCALVGQLSQSVAAFVTDLKRRKLLDRVLLMTFSEFGRTVRENGRRGTGHGAAAPVFLAGGKLKGGLTGEHPSLTDLDNDAPKHKIDFRRLYATVLDRWLGFDSKAVLGRQFEPLDIFNA